MVSEISVGSTSLPATHMHTFIQTTHTLLLIQSNARILGLEIYPIHPEPGPFSAQTNSLGNYCWLLRNVCMLPSSFRLTGTLLLS